jgi:hypothetical protein
LHLTRNNSLIAITAEEIEEAKKSLPFGWGRFGKAIDRLGEISEPDESLLATCAAQNPEYHQSGKFVPGTTLGSANALLDLAKATNVLLACTTERLIVIPTGVAGGPRDHSSVPLDGLEIVSRQKRVFILGWPGGRMRIRGPAKQQVPRFLEAVADQARPPDASPT